MHCMMVLVMVFPTNRWYIVKICMCHWWVSITDNTWRFDASSSDPQSVYIGLPPDSRGSSYNIWNICCGRIDHLWCWSTKSKLYQMPQTKYWNSDFRSLIYIKNWFWWHTVCHISVVPLSVIIIVFAPARTADRIWWCPLQIPHLCGISHLLTYKLSHVEQGVRSPYIVALDCIFTITVGSTLKIGPECIYICTNSQKLPNWVNPITKFTSQLNSH